MAEIKVVADIAGRVCVIAVEAGGQISDGDDIVLIEAMKMEIPVPSPAAGTVVSVLVKVGDMVAEGQTIASISA
jgi:biotin carboxyl carrier protein